MKWKRLQCKLCPCVCKIGGGGGGSGEQSSSSSCTLGMEVRQFAWIGWIVAAGLQHILCVCVCGYFLQWYIIGSHSQWGGEGTLRGWRQGGTKPSQVQPFQVLNDWQQLARGWGWANGGGSREEGGAWSFFVCKIWVTQPSLWASLAMAPMADFVDDKGSTKTYLCHDLGYAPREPDDVDDVDDDGIYTPPPFPLAPPYKQHNRRCKCKCNYKYKCKSLHICEYEFQNTFQSSRLGWDTDIPTLRLFFYFLDLDIFENFSSVRSEAGSVSC